MADELERRVPALAETLVRDVGCPARLAMSMQAFVPVMHLRAFADMAPLLDDHTFDVQGRQLSSEHGGRRVVRYEGNGSVTVIAELR